MKCPGQDSRYWKPGAVFEVECPRCGAAVEFFKDDPSRKCGRCDHRFVNPHMDFGCAAYCPHAGQCIGNLPPEAVAQRDHLLKDRVAVEMKRYFKTDFKRIGHASRVARHAEKIGRGEKADPAVVLISGYLHDIGIHEAERKHGSTAARFQEQEGPSIARFILEKLGAREDLITEVCDIVGHHHHPRTEETVNFKVLYDADLIANLEEQHKIEPMDESRLENLLPKAFLTVSGRNIAQEVLGLKKRIS